MCRMASEFCTWVLFCLVFPSLSHLPAGERSKFTRSVTVFTFLFVWIWCSQYEWYNILPVPIVQFVFLQLLVRDLYSWGNVKHNWLWNGIKGGGALAIYFPFNNFNGVVLSLSLSLSRNIQDALVAHYLRVPEPQFIRHELDVFLWDNYTWWLMQQLWTLPCSIIY